MGVEAVSFKGTGDGVKIILSSDADFARIMHSITDKIKNNRSFFKGGGKIYFTGREFSKSDKLRLESVAHTYIPDCEVLFGEETVKSDTSSVQSKAGVRYESASILTVTLLERSVARDEQLRVQGHMVIVGDVSEGAEITAGGNIIVLGRTSGMLRAGYPTMENAYIIMLHADTKAVKIGTIRSDESISERLRSGSSVKLNVIDGKIICNDFK